MTRDVVVQVTQGNAVTAWGSAGFHSEHNSLDVRLGGAIGTVLNRHFSGDSSEALKVLSHAIMRLSPVDEPHAVPGNSKEWDGFSSQEIALMMAAEGCLR